VGDDDVVQGFWICVGIGQGQVSSFRTKVRGHKVIRGVTPLRYLGDIPELCDDTWIVCRVERLPVVQKELVPNEVLVLDLPGRDTATGASEYRISSCAHSDHWLEGFDRDRAV